MFLLLRVLCAGAAPPQVPHISCKGRSMALSRPPQFPWVPLRFTPSEAHFQLPFLLASIHLPLPFCSIYDHHREQRNGSSALPWLIRDLKGELTRLPPCQNVLRLSFQEREMLLESLIGTESQASSQLPSSVCPSTDSKALLYMAHSHRLRAGAEAGQARLMLCEPCTTLGPVSLAYDSLADRDQFLSLREKWACPQNTLKLLTALFLGLGHPHRC